MTFLTSIAGNGGILPPEYAGLITKPLTENALPFQSALATTLTTAKHELILPTLETDVSAAWVNEGEEIGTSLPTLSETKIVFGKVAALTPVSSEMAKDSSPEATELIGQSITRAIIAQVNKSFLGNLAAPAPKGLESVTGTNLALSMAPAITNLDIFIAAESQLELSGRTVTGWILNPSDAAAIAMLKDTADSNRRLVEDVNTITGKPVYRHASVPVGSAWALDANYLYTGLREDIEIAISDQVYFSSDRLAVRATARIGYGFTDPKAIAKVTLYTP